MREPNQSLERRTGVGVPRRDGANFSREICLVRQCSSTTVRERNGQTPQTAAQAAGVCSRTVRKSVARFRVEGVAGLIDRSSRPKRLYCPTSPAIVARAIAMRRERLPDQHIARTVGVAPATVSRLANRSPPEPVRRYERQHPGELIHLDVKKLGRFC
jgi:hypothetical protein